MTADETSPETASGKTIAAYGFLALPLAFAGLPLYIHVPDYYTREIGLGLASAGIILMALRIIDAVQDPLIGYVSDKGPAFQKSVMGFGVLLLLAGMGALLAGPLAFVPVAYWFAGAIALTALGLSMCNINLVAIGSLWSKNEATRARASATREAMSLAGMLLASALPGILILSMSKPQAFEIFYILFAVLLLAGFFVFSRFLTVLTKSNPENFRKPNAQSLPLPFKFFTKNIGFLSACFLTHIASSLPAILFLYFVTDYLGEGGKAGAFLFLYFLSGAGFMALWVKIRLKHSAERAWLTATILAFSAFIWAFFLNEGDFFQFGIICLLSGAALGADLALPPLIMAKRLQEQGGKAYATQAYAILNLLPKIALALATCCAFLLLDKADFSPSGTNTPAALGTLAVLYALLPCLTKMASAVIIFYMHKGVSHEIQKRSFGNEHTHGA